MSEKTREEQIQEYEAAKEQFLLDLKKSFPNAPDKSQVDIWKASAGRIRVAPFNEDEVYILRAVKSAEYKGMIEQARTSGNPDQFLKELVVMKCVLWPRQDTSTIADMYAGTIDTLYTIVMQSSNFLTASEVAMLVREL